MPVEVSADALFAGPIFMFKVRYHNHLNQLREAVRRVRAAMERAAADRESAS